MATQAVLPPHVAVAHQLVGMCHHGIDPANRHQAIERAQQLAGTLDRREWALLASWACPGQGTHDSPSTFAARVVDCLAGIAIDNDRDPFDGVAGHDGYITNKAERAAMARGVGR